MKKGFYALLAVCLCLNLGVYLLLHTQMKKIAVADAVRLFNNYNMKKELESKDEPLLKFLNSRLDSLDAVIKNTSTSAASDEKQAQLYTSYKETQSLLEESYRRSNQAINEQVWTRLNPLIEEYGKKYGYRLIVGANGMGSVLYHDGYYDVTEDLIKFVNNKYEGK